MTQPGRVTPEAGLLRYAFVRYGWFRRVVENIPVGGRRDGELCSPKTLADAAHDDVIASFYLNQRSRWTIHKARGLLSAPGDIRVATEGEVDVAQDLDDGPASRT